MEVPGYHALPIRVPTRSVRGRERKRAGAQYGVGEAVGLAVGVIGIIEVEKGYPYALAVTLCNKIRLASIMVTISPTERDS